MSALLRAAVRRVPALAHRDYRNLVTGQVVSTTGSQMQLVAVAWQLWRLTGSPVALGAVGGVRVAPVILFALGGGVLADRLDRRRILLVTQTTLMLVSATLALATHLGFASPALLYALLALGGAAVAFDNPARGALVPRLVPREDLPSALGLNALAFQVATIAGPAAAGLLLARGGAEPVYWLDAASFLAVLGALATMRHRAPPAQLAGSGLDAVLEGVRFLRRTPAVRSTMLLDFFATFLGGSMLLLPVFADRILDVGPRGLGLLYAAQPLGAALAGALLASRRLPVRQGLAVLVAVAVYGAAVAVFGVSRSFALSVAALALSGAADTVSMVIRQALRQLLTSDELRGRMNSLNMIFFMGGPQLGEVEAGLVAGWLGVRTSVASGGLACVALALVFALAVPSLARYRGEPAPQQA
jgi:MFS family permease